MTGKYLRKGRVMIKNLCNFSTSSSVTTNLTVFKTKMKMLEALGREKSDVQNIMRFIRKHQCYLPEHSTNSYIMRILRRILILCIRYILGFRSCVEFSPLNPSVTITRIDTAQTLNVSHTLHSGREIIRATIVLECVEIMSQKPTLSQLRTNIFYFAGIK
jgi:hypothetical protein